MARGRSPRADNLRQAIAQEAARLMIEHGHGDYGVAKRKAAERMGVTDQAVLPKNAEIEQAIAGHQRLFVAEAHASELAGMRAAAAETMRLLAAFEPRLVGPLLSGTATAHAVIALHLFADTPEAVALALMDRGIPYEFGERRFRVQRDAVESWPEIRFSAGMHEVEATIFPKDGIRQAPPGPVDGKPMRRATLAEVEGLLIDKGDASN
ncbi:MAG: hypothetical protein KF822_00565 [Steroidobacteraceae bacterium]|nr:hypothetical protein [Steroidobacteraceae bacterium]